MSGVLSVAAITPAFNEAERISELAESMAAQTQRPISWIIVDDGSSDDTYAVASEAVANLGFGQVISVDRQYEGRNFGRKALAVRAGHTRLANQKTVSDLFACVDADAVLPKIYFAEIANRFARNSSLGVAGGTYRHQIGGKCKARRNPKEHVPGVAQVFRKEVYDKIGGYWELRYGGIDTAANYAARMYGWQTQSFPELEVRHSRRMGSSAGHSPAKAEFIKGKQDWDLATKPSFELAKLVRSLADPPHLLGSLARAMGYGSAALARNPPTVTSDFKAYVRMEQQLRLRDLRPFGS